MKKYAVVLLFFVACTNQNSNMEESQTTTTEVSFTTATTLISEYDQLKEGDKKSYKIRQYWIQNILKDVPTMTEEEKSISYREADNPNEYVYLDDGTSCTIDVGGTIHGSLIDENFQLDFDKINNNNSSSTLEKMNDTLFNDGYQITLEVFYNCTKDDKFSWLYGPLFFQDGQWWSFTDTDIIDFPTGEGNYWRQSTRVKVNLGTKSKWEICNEDIYSDECGVEYNPTTEFFWGYSKFFIELREKITIWDKNSRTMLRNSEIAYPEELLPIMSSPVFDIEEFGETYNCYIFPMASMVYYIRNYGYPQPLSSIENGEENFINWPEVYWLCLKEEIEFPNEIAGGFKEFDSGDFYLGQGPPVLRGDFGNRDPNPRYASWIMWGPSDPEDYYNNDLKSVKEFNVTKFYWWFDDGFNILDLCLNTIFTYEKDYDFVCLDKGLNN